MLGGFTYADIALAILALICVIVGYKKGFMSQFFALVKFIGVALLAFFCYPFVSPIFQGFLLGPLEGVFSFVENATQIATVICDGISFILIAIVGSIVVSIIEKALNKAKKSKILGNLDKVLGLAYSVAILYLVVLALDFGLDYLASLEAVQGIEFVAKLINTINSQFSDGKLISFIINGNWLATLLAGAISSGAGG